MGLLGCSVQTLDLIHQINRLRVSSLERPSDTGPVSLFQQRVILERGLQNLTQRLEPAEKDSAIPFGRECVDAKATAELYRLAGLLYLQRVCPTPGDEVRRTDYLEQAFAALDTLHVATSPWPIFVIACESQHEEQRILTSQILDQMESIRSIGNILVMRNIIETIWKQQDLRGNLDRAGQIGWWLFVDCDVAAPWFA